MLTKEQQAVVNHRVGHQLVTACPGSGKTHTVVERVLGLAEMANGRTGIGIISFTTAAIDEISQRLCRNGAQEALQHPNFVGTFDQFVSRFLIQPFGIKLSKKFPRIVDSWETLGVRINPPQGRGAPISLDHMTVHPDGTAELIPDRINNRQVRNQLARQPEIWQRPAQRLYERLTRAGVITCRIARVLANERLSDNSWRTALGRALSARFSELIIDEAQDSNPDDIRIIEWLAESGIQLTVVWDPDQAIYGFRGSDASAVWELARQHNFEHRQLTGNFRSSPAICRFAGTLRNSRAADEPIGKYRSLDVPVKLLSYQGHLSSTIGGYFRDLVVGLGFDLTRSAVLAHRLKDSCRCAGLTPAEDLGQNQLLQLLLAKKELLAASSRPTAREKALLRAERTLLLKITGIDERPADLICEEYQLDRRWIRRLALKALIDLPDLESASEEGVAAWAAEAREVLNGLGRICLNGASVGSGMRRPDYREIKKIASSQAEDDVVPAYTIHSAKGSSFDCVLLVVPPDASGSNRTRSLLEAWAGQQAAEAKSVIYVGATRAERLLAVAIPSAIEQTLVVGLRKAGVDVDLVQLKDTPPRAPRRSRRTVAT